ncbi:MAG: hypothetical protein ACK4OM_02380 [Alphaproteobacteria bacterium]
MVETINIISMKWGKLYNAEYVNRLYNGVKKNLTKQFRFYCFTDDNTGLNPDITAMALPTMPIPQEKRISPWLKLAVYQKDFAGLKGKSLFLDLDNIIIDNIDDLIDYSDKYSIAENWTQKGQDIGNTSVFTFNISEYSFIYDEFIKDPIKITNDYDNEQIFVSRMLSNQKIFYPDSWIKSFKRHCIKKGLLRFIREPIIPKGCKIIAFHGHPKPHEALRGEWPKKVIPYMKPAKWIEKYW